MHILILNYEYPPLGGGAGMVTQHLANEFSTLGHQVTILTTWYIGESTYSVDGNITIIRLTSKRKFAYQSNPVEMYDWIKKAISYSKSHFSKSQFDVVLANFTLPGAAVAIYLKKKFNLPYVILSHGHDIPWFSPKQMFFWHLLFYPVLKYLLLESRYNILLTTQLKKNADNFLGGKHTSKNKVISNGLLPFNVRTGFNAEDKVINALFVGRLVDQKDPMTVVRAFKFLQQQQIPIHLKFIGDGKLKDDIERYIIDNNLNNIELVGKISQSQVVEEYSNAHILIAPSREEAMSLVILEAVASGVYVFATEVSGNREVIFEGINGDFVKYNNPENIATKIKLFYEDKFMKNYTYPKLMIEFMMKNYSWKSRAEEYIKLFETMINTNQV